MESILEMNGRGGCMFTMVKLVTCYFFIINWKNALEICQIGTVISYCKYNFTRLYSVKFLSLDILQIVFVLVKLMGFTSA